MFRVFSCFFAADFSYPNLRFFIRFINLSRQKNDVVLETFRFAENVQKSRRFRAFRASKDETANGTDDKFLLLPLDLAFIVFPFCARTEIHFSFIIQHSTFIICELNVASHEQLTTNN